MAKDCNRTETANQMFEMKALAARLWRRKGEFEEETTTTAAKREEPSCQRCRCKTAPLEEEYATFEVPHEGHGEEDGEEEEDGDDDGDDDDDDD